MILMSNDGYGKRPLRLSPKLAIRLSLMILITGFLAGCDFIPREFIPIPDSDKEESDKKIKEMDKKAAEAAQNSEGSKKSDEPNTQFSQIVPEGDPVEIFSNNNIKVVSNGGTPAQFTTEKDVWMGELGSYHWNNGAGAPAGTLRIESADGKTSYGPWQVELSDLGGTRKVYWIAKPNAWLPAGSYRVIDSDPSTWAQNTDTGGQGIAWIKGIKDTGKSQ